MSNDLPKREKRTYTTKDIRLATALMMKDVELIETKKQQNDRRTICTFIFQYDTWVQEVIDDFYAKKLLFEPIAWEDAKKNLKNFIYNK